MTASDGRQVEKPHLSQTQLTMYCRCGEQYRRRYMDHERIPPGIAALVGTGFHVGAEVNLRQKVESHEDLPASEIVDAAVSGFEARYSEDGCLFTNDEASRGVSLVVGEAKDKVAQIAEAHAIQQAPDYQPVEIETNTRIVLPQASHDLVVITDLRDDQDRVTDWKTAGKKRASTDAETSLQLTICAAAFMVDHGFAPSEVRLDVMTTAKTPARQVLSSQRTQADFVALSNRLNAVLDAIQKGVFPPTNPENWWCSIRFCGFAKSCPYCNHNNGG